ncbi:MAG TPA: CDGSH iron-sulfur domain-containing protein [Alphaproteobacteria bacterium]|nr:CDGSH iron-sulfur domain-containing protein [Alphaproteobacteria bacterium]
MTEAVIAQRGPFEVSVQAEKTYFWCACGRSKKQPFCDGSHKGTGFEPVAWKAVESGPVWFCGCKRTGNRPCCDGSHNAL